MNRDRVEEMVLVVIAACMLSYLLPFSLARNIIVTLVVAFSLVILLILRSLSWHAERVTPFDGILILGICISVLYLVSFYAFQRSLLSAIVIVLFAAYYALMAFLLYQHRWLFRHAAQSTPHASHSHKAARRRFGFFRRHDKHFREGIEPIPEMTEHNHKRDPIFRKGMEPLHELTAEHMHKLGVYDLRENRKKKS